MKPKKPNLADCPDAAGSFNNPTAVDDELQPAGSQGVGSLANGTTANPYVAPDLCIGDYNITSTANAADALYQQQVAAENLAISGADVNIFKLLGIHEQGKLVDLTGNGQALGSGVPANAFNSLLAPWVSDEVGPAVTGTPAYIGYDFGIRLTSFGLPEVVPDANLTMNITTFQITQGVNQVNRVLQVRVESSNGGYRIDPTKVLITGVGNGTICEFNRGYAAKPGLIMATATSSTTFTVMFTGSGGTQIFGIATVGVRFNSPIGSFLIKAGTTPFGPGDLISAPVELDWKRVDVVNLPNVSTPAVIRINQSARSRYWRLVPLLFAGGATDPWVVQNLQFYDYQQTRLDDIQDTLYMENRDRDYASVSLQIRAAYTPFDAVSDLSKFGFQIADIYTFTTTYATMITALGRPIVVGDIIELPAELEYDHNLRPVRKFLEVSNVGWSSQGFTTTWEPIIYQFQAQNLIPAQEHRDILGTVDTQKYIIDDGTFFDGVEQIQTAPLTVTEMNNQEAVKAVPRTGTNIQEEASGTNRFGNPGTYDGVGPYVEDGLPPDAQPYTSGFGTLPDVATATDGQFFRLEYDPKLKIPARLYKFSSMKNSWIYVETDCRASRTSFRPSQLEILNSGDVLPLTTKKVT